MQGAADFLITPNFLQKSCLPSTLYRVKLEEKCYSGLDAYELIYTKVYQNKVESLNPFLHSREIKIRAQGE